MKRGKRVLIVQCNSVQSVDFLCHFVCVILGENPKCSYASRIASRPIFKTVGPVDALPFAALVRLPLQQYYYQMFRVFQKTLI